MATVFSIDGPREVPYFQGKGGRTILDENVRQFWEKNAEIAESRGCYVFGIRAGKGLTPAYVGKATKTFKQEVFSHHKLTRYQQFLANYQKGTPILFFVVAPTKRGVPNISHIEELEDFLASRLAAGSLASGRSVASDPSSRYVRTARRQPALPPASAHIALLALVDLARCGIEAKP